VAKTFTSSLIASLAGSPFLGAAYCSAYFRISSLVTFPPFPVGVTFLNCLIAGEARTFVSPSGAFDSAGGSSAFGFSSSIQ
jgi:hypothetical protein